jgi:transcription initiation factor TFIIH subunit 3
MLSSAISLGLCYINRLQHNFGTTETLNYRLLVVQLNEDGSHQYMNFMNMIFTAEKLVIFFELINAGKCSTIIVIFII